jgi:hypothetical protein
MHDSSPNDERRELARQEGRDLLPAHEQSDPTTATLSAIERMVKDPEVDVNKLEALLRMQREFEDRAAERAFNQSMRECQREIKPIWKNKAGEGNKYRYADLEYIDGEISDIVYKHGFSCTYDNPEVKGSDVSVKCTVLHTGGHSRDYSLSGQLDVAGPKGGATKTPIQGLGSTVSFLRRYLKAMIFDLVFKNEDKDGRAAGGFLDEHQVNAILDMFIHCGMDPLAETKFLEIVSQKAGAPIKTVNEIPKRFYGECMALLQQKLRSVQKDAK